MTQSEPTPTTPAAETPALLQYHERREYRPSGKVKISRFFIALAGAFFVAILSALAVWTWMVFVERGMIFGVIAPIIGHGILVGAALFHLFRWARLRNVPLALVIALLCALFSAVCFQGAVYVRAIHRTEARFRVDLADKGYAPDSPQMKRAEAFMAHPFDFYDQFVLVPKTGHRGFPGFLRLRWENAPGWIIFQVLALIIAASTLAWQASNRPYCETCDVWYGAPIRVTSLGRKWADLLLEAVGADDPRLVLALLQAAADDPGSGVARVKCAVHRCPQCANSLADLFLTSLGKNKNETKKISPLLRVSAETVLALKTEVAPSTVDV